MREAKTCPSLYNVFKEQFFAVFGPVTSCANKIQEVRNKEKSGKGKAEAKINSSKFYEGCFLNAAAGCDAERSEDKGSEGVEEGPHLNGLVHNALWK